MTSTRVVALVATLVAFPAAWAAAAPQQGPKQAARQLPLDAGGHPVPVRPTVQPVAYDGSQAALVGRLSAALTSLQSVIGDFVQIAPDGSRSAGRFYIQKPGRMRFEYEPPSPVDVIADGHDVVVRDRSLRTEDLYPLSQTPLRYLLAERLDLARDTNLAAIGQDSAFITLTIDEQHLLAGNYRLVLVFTARDLQLRQWTVTDPQGYETTTAVYNLDAVHKPDPGKFVIGYQPAQQ